MFLIPTTALEGNINEYYTRFRSGSTLLGYFPCQNTDDIWCSYYSVLSKDGKQRVVPVFLVEEMVFDTELEDAVPGWALFFHGCDDGHLGLKFNDEFEAVKWLQDCQYVDFNQLYMAYSEGTIKLHYYN